MEKADEHPDNTVVSHLFLPGNLNLSLSTFLPGIFNLKTYCPDRGLKHGTSDHPRPLTDLAIHLMNWVLVFAGLETDPRCYNPAAPRLTALEIPRLPPLRLSQGWQLILRPDFVCEAVAITT